MIDIRKNIYENGLLIHNVGFKYYTKDALVSDLIRITGELNIMITNFSTVQIEIEITKLNSCESFWENINAEGIQAVMEDNVFDNVTIGYDSTGNMTGAIMTKTKSSHPCWFDWVADDGSIKGVINV